MATWDPRAFEDALIEDMRTHGGQVTSGPLAGEPILVLNTTGARSGEARRAILNFSRDGSDYVVAGSKGGAPTDPAWVANLAAHPTASVEAEGRRFQATAIVERQGPERDRLWAAHVRTLPKFADYPEKSGRVIPMVRLRPTAAG